MRMVWRVPEINAAVLDACCRLSVVEQVLSRLATARLRSFVARDQRDTVKVPSSVQIERAEHVPKGIEGDRTV